jgi:hypothetical protein
MIPDGCNGFNMVNLEPTTAADAAPASLADLIEPATGGDLLPAVAAVDQGVPPIEPMSLDLGDLLPDQAGEVVLMGDGDIPFNIHSTVPVTAAGIADVHVTASGVDVTGLHYYSFESGITLYSPTDLSIDGTHGVG